MVITLFLALLFPTFATSDTIDSKWMKEALSYDYSAPPTQLVHDFMLAHPSDISSYIPEDEDRPYLDFTSIDLDGDGQPEYLMFIGPRFDVTMFCVIKRFQTSWRLIFYQDVPEHGEILPHVNLLDTPSKYKTFYLRWYYYSGTGNWLYTYRFYKVIGGQVVQVLEFVQDSNLALCASDIIGQMTTTRVSEEMDFMPPIHEQLLINYSYNLGKMGCNTSRPMKTYPPDITLFQNDIAFAFYDWNPEKEQFIFHESEGRCELTEKQLDYFRADLGNDTLFVRDFSEKLNELAVSGDPSQQKAAKYFLTKYKK
jgi:hypothetical protein